MCDSGPPTAPIENGTTYIVRPRIDPSKSGVRVARISAGLAQLLVGPASSSRSEAMKVRASVRATSLGCERARYEPGRHSGLSLMSLPSSTCWRRRASFSAREPSTQWMRAGCVSAAISSTHAASSSRPAPASAGRPPAAREADASCEVPSGNRRWAGEQVGDGHVSSFKRVVLFHFAPL
jgi:hypothetical protein